MPRGIRPQDRGGRHQMRIAPPETRRSPCMRTASKIKGGWGVGKYGKKSKNVGFQILTGRLRRVLHFAQFEQIVEIVRFTRISPVFGSHDVRSTCAGSELTPARPPDDPSMTCHCTSIACPDRFRAGLDPSLTQKPEFPSSNLGQGTNTLAT